MTIPMIPMFLCLCAKKKEKTKKKKRADPTPILKESLAKRMTKANNITSKVTRKKRIWLLNHWHAMMATFFINQRWKLALDILCT